MSNTTPNYRNYLLEILRINIPLTEEELSAIDIPEMTERDLEEEVEALSDQEGWEQAQDQYRASMLQVLILKLNLNDSDAKAFGSLPSANLERVVAEALYPTHRDDTSSF